MDYRPTWNLPSIPSDVWNSENGRRVRPVGSPATYIKLAPCKECGEILNATQRRRACPKCGVRNEPNWHDKQLCECGKPRHAHVRNALKHKFRLG